MFNAKVLHNYNVLLDATKSTSEYQHTPRFKDIYFYITQNQLHMSVPVQRIVKFESLNYVIINKLLF